MTKRLLVALAMLFTALNSPLGVGAAQAPPRQYFVDYAKGDDGNNGQAPQQAWKHAPGDPQASGQPRAVRLGPGDRVIFAAGVVYRGTIDVTSSGTPDAPIIFEGADGKPAVISGAERLSALPCAETAACDGAPAGAVLLKIDRALALAETIFDDAGPLRLAQSPNPELAQYPDEPTEFYSIATNRIATGQIRLPAPTEDCLADCSMEIALWVQSNVVVTRPILAVTGGIATFDPQGLKFYTDRDTRYTLRGFRAFLDQPGEFLPVGDGLVLALPRPGAACCEIASGRGGFTLRNSSWVTIRNLEFRHMADGNLFGKGIGIFANTPGIAGITITGNRLHDFDLRSGTGAINMRGVSDLTISKNTITAVQRGSGIRLAGPSDRTTISDNRISRIGRTAIYVSIVNDVEVTGNTITDIRGVHGNGLTAYLANQRVAFRRNTVVEAKQPATFHGSGPQNLIPHNLIFEQNVLITTPDSLGSLISWGQQTRNVIIRENVLLGGRFGLRMSKADFDVTALRNVGMPPAPTAPVSEPGGRDANRWLMAPPSWQKALVEQANGTRTLAPAQHARLCQDIFGKDASGLAVGAAFVCP